MHIPARPQTKISHLIRNYQYHGTQQPHPKHIFAASNPRISFLSQSPAVPEWSEIEWCHEGQPTKGETTIILCYYIITKIDLRTHLQTLQIANVSTAGHA